MTAKRAGSKGAKTARAETAEAPAVIEPKPTAASREKDKEDPVPTFRVDLGESIPTSPIRTATDNE